MRYIAFFILLLLGSSSFAKESFPKTFTSIVIEVQKEYSPDSFERMIKPLFVTTIASVETANGTFKNADTAKRAKNYTGRHAIGNEKFLCIQHGNEPVNTNLLRMMNVEERDNRGYIIGGLFGGDRHILSFMHEEFNKLVDVAYDNDFLVLEELLLSVLFSKYYDKCVSFKFENWYHDCPGGSDVDRCCYGVPDSVYSFYKIFYKDFLKHE